MSVNGIGLAGVVSGYEAGRSQKYKKEETPDFLQAMEENTKNTVEEQADQAEKAFETVGPNAPESVKKAWMEAAKEVGANGLGVKANGMLSHISQMMVQRLTNQMQGKQNPDDILGNSVDSAISAVRKAIYDIDNPIGSRGVQSIEVQRAVMQERQFYKTFLDKLQHLGKSL